MSWGIIHSHKEMKQVLPHQVEREGELWRTPKLFGKSVLWILENVETDLTHTQEGRQLGHLLGLTLIPVQRSRSGSKQQVWAPWKRDRLQAP